MHRIRGPGTDSVSVRVDERRIDMLEKKGFWYLLMAGALALWTSAVLVGLVFFSSASWLALVVLVALFVVHCAEIPVASKVGREKGLSTSRVVIKTLIFGFTWWVAVKRGVLEQ